MGTETKAYIRVKIKDGSEEAFKELIRFKHSGLEAKVFNWEHFVCECSDKLMLNESNTYMLHHEHALIKDGYFYFTTHDFKDYAGVLDIFLYCLSQFSTEGVVVYYLDTLDDGTYGRLNNGSWTFGTISDFTVFKEDYLTRLENKWFHRAELIMDKDLPKSLSEELYEAQPLRYIN